MNWLQKTSNEDLFDMDISFPQKIKQDPPQQESIILTLYRGLDLDLDNLEKSGNQYILSPHKSEQGLIWFSRDLSVAEGRGDWILTYPLKVIKHFERIYYDDGSVYNQIPDEINQICNPTENCRFYGGIELPEGWFFSYKNEKHIVSSIPIRITRNMLQKKS